MNTVGVEAKVKVFVYGTLKQGFGNHHIIEGQSMIGEDTITGLFRMQSLGMYPGLVVDDEHVGTVHGEVYEVDPDCMVRLNILEGVPHLYRAIPMITDKGIHCLTYLLNEEHATGMVVRDGVWLKSDRF